MEEGRLFSTPYINYGWFVVCTKLYWTSVKLKVIMYQLYRKRWAKNDHPLVGWKVFSSCLSLFSGCKGYLHGFLHVAEQKRHNLSSPSSFPSYQVPSAVAPSRTFVKKATTQRDKLLKREMVVLFEIRKLQTSAILKSWETAFFSRLLRRENKVPFSVGKLWKSQEVCHIAGKRIL